MSLLNQYPCVNVSAPAYLSFATASFALLSGVVASVGNLLVVLAVFLDPHKELRSSFSYFVASLGFADLITGNPGSVIVPQYGSSKITVFVWGKNIILKFLGNTK